MTQNALVDRKIMWSYDRMNSVEIDQHDIAILRALQQDSGLSQRDLAERIGLSQNACWRRLNALRDRGIITGQSVRLDREKLGLKLVVFAMIRTRHHSAEWLAVFRRQVALIDEVVDFYRIGGDYDYLLKVVVADIAGYDSVYQRLIERVELDSVTAYFAMESILESRPLPLER